MEKTNITEIITKYFKAVCDAYSLGNVESSYNAPIMALFTDIGCAARDLSGERKGQSGENIDIKLWHTEDVREGDRLCRMIPLHDSRINAAGFERLAEQMNVRGQA